ncbi:MAG TPA: 16S rRNA (guanine(966)-N(2))-methyltransferase RsmD [Candidatus Kapabacteria bacterium]|jgi:16S rRNA (guanine966-N2)-methyltransferase
MRIVAGEFRSRILLAPKSTATRPTTDRARESLFNVLNNLIDFDGIRVLDLYAGSGAFAFEALSRGAKHATLVERDRHALQAIEANANSLQVTDRVTIMNADVISFLKRNPSGRSPLELSALERFDLIFSDAPYDDAQAKKEVPSLLERWIESKGLCVLEHRSSDMLELPEGMERKRELKAGEAAFTIFQQKTEQ